MTIKIYLPYNLITMLVVSYSPNLKGEVEISASKNAALPIVSANYILDEQINLVNKPNIADINLLDKIFHQAKEVSNNYFDLTMPETAKLRGCILLIPYGLLNYGEVRLGGSWGCNLGKRPLDMFDDGFKQAGVDVVIDPETGMKTYTVVGKPKKNIMMGGFAVTAIEALVTYLAFLQDVDYPITIYQVAIEPNVQDLIHFLNQAWADISLHHDHTLTINPKKITKEKIANTEYQIISDYIEAGTYFAIGAGADNSEITIKNVHVDDLSSMYALANKIGIDYKIIDKNTIRVSSKNKANYQASKLEARIYPGFPTDLQSIWATLMTQCHGISRVFETMYEGRFSFLGELDNLGADSEVLNPHQAIIVGPAALKGAYVASKDLRCGASMILAGIMAQGDTHILYEKMIFRGYENIIEKLKNIGVNIKIEREKIRG